MQLILVRHGETEYNRADVFRGRVDLPLNERGRMQARAAASCLRETDFEAFYSSPLRRSMETARAIAEPHGGEVRPLEEFNDVDYGLWSGKSVDEVREAWPELFSIWVDNPEEVVFPEGESLRAVRERLQAGLDRLAEQHDGTILLVGHKLINRLLICIVLDLPTAAFWHVDQSNGAINVIAHGELGWVLRRMNDVGHLKGMESADQRT
ncbi:MAG: histidine phosphatase family protein [Actinobacteria bacterium]|nr:histidine phosphatase family protein [Actinomycetota bacterium]